MSVRIVLSFVFVTVFACAPNDDRRVFTGQLGSTDALVAGIVQNDRFVFYACGGDTTFKTHTVWFDGTLESGETMIGTDSKFDLGAEVGDASIEGTLTINGIGALRFTAAESTDEMFGELLKDINNDTWATAAILTQRGLDATPQLQGVGCDENEVVGQVRPVGPFSKQDEFVNVQVMTSTMTRPFVLSRVFP